MEGVLTLGKPTSQTKDSHPGASSDERQLAPEQICEPPEKEKQAALQYARLVHETRSVMHQGAIEKGGPTELSEYADMIHCSLDSGMLRSFPMVGSDKDTAVELAV